MLLEFVDLLSINKFQLEMQLFRANEDFSNDIGVFVDFFSVFVAEKCQNTVELNATE